MKITSIGAVLLQPFPWVLVKVRTDSGLVGIGEAYHGAGVHQIAVDPRLTRSLIRKDPRNVDRLFRDMQGSMSASGFYQGAVMSAISGIEMALWDITGQACGVPIWQLLGGRFRDEIRLYNDCHAGNEEDPASWVAKALEVQGRGFDAIKFDIDPRSGRRDDYNRGIRNRDIAYYVETVTAVRQALDPDTDLLIDAPPPHREIEFDVEIFSPKTGTYRHLREVSPVIDALARTQFDDYVKRVRLFAHPRLAAPLSDPEQFSECLERALERVEPAETPRGD